MRSRIFILLFLMVTGTGLGQEKKSKGDIFFYQYNYASAILEYQKEMKKAPLTSHQQLNLADSYFQTGDFANASKGYMEVNKNDTIMSNHRFNKMLQSLSKTSDTERIKVFLNSRMQSLSNELSENAEFNFELLETEPNGQGLKITNINGNSPQSDFSPTFYKDNRLLFSSGRIQKSKKTYDPTGESYLDIYVARINPDGNIMNPNVFSNLPDSKYHKSTPYYSAVQEALYYILSNADGDRLSFDSNGKNALAMGMVDSVGSFRYLLRDFSTSFYYPFYEESTGKLYFAANFYDSYGGTDIYFVYTNGGQIMSQPINLGPRINSPGNEIAPYIFGNSLYFSSDVFYGMGGMDIYKSNLQEDGSFSIPVNLGSGLNSPADDFGLIIRNNGTEGYSGYFASNRSGGKGNDDIYGFRIGELPGLKTLILKGTVAKPNSGAGIHNATITVMDPDKNIIKQIVTDETGKYQLEIPWRDDIVLEATKGKHSDFTATMDKTELERLQKNPLNIEMIFLDDAVVEKENMRVLKVRDFFFAKGRSETNPDMGLELDKVADLIKKFPQIKLRIENHTDSRGSNTSNKNLSQRRADAIKQYLLKNGAAAANIAECKGYGEERIVNNCKDGVYCLDFLHRQNERTLFVVLNEDELD